MGSKRSLTCLTGKKHGLIVSVERKHERTNVAAGLMDRDPDPGENPVQVVFPRDDCRSTSGSCLCEILAFAYASFLLSDLRPRKSSFAGWTGTKEGKMARKGSERFATKARNPIRTYEVAYCRKWKAWSTRCHEQMRTSPQK